MELCLQTYQGQMETRKTLQRKHLKQSGGIWVGMRETAGLFSRVLHNHLQFLCISTGLSRCKAVEM